MAEPRPEYAALAAEFARLAAPFGHAFDEPLQRDITRLARAIERIDRIVDDAVEDGERRARWRFVLERLGPADPPGAAAPDGRFPSELREGADELRAIGDARGILPRLRRIVAKEAKTSEAMRAARTSAAFVSLVLREGRLTAALALVVAGRACGARFRRFFFRLGGPANLVDKIKDARDDHARGEIRLLPSPLFYGRLFGSLVFRSVALMATHPRPAAVVSLGVRYLRG